MASIRDSLYDLMYNDTAAQQLLGATRSSLMADIVHPTAAGFKVFGDVVAYSVRQTLAAVFTGSAAQLSLAPDNTARLPPAISPIAAQQDAQPWCKEGLSFQPYAACVTSSADAATGSAAIYLRRPGITTGCHWKNASIHLSCPHDNCRTRGYFMKGIGQALTITLDTRLTAAAGSSTAGSSSSSSTATQFESRCLVVTYVQGSQAPKMGTAVLACVQGCRCRATRLSLYPDPCWALLLLR
jgi:hypothetical protein